VSTTFVTCPAEASQTLGIKMPFLVMIIKNMRKYFSFEVTVRTKRRSGGSTPRAHGSLAPRRAGDRRQGHQAPLPRLQLPGAQRWQGQGHTLLVGADNASWLLRFAQSATRVKPFICTMPMRLDEGWNQIQFNLADFCRRAYGTAYVETLRVQVHCSCRVRRIYFSDRLYAEEELPAEFKLFVPVRSKAGAAAPAGEDEEELAADEGGASVGAYAQQELGELEYDAE
jgi:hypothetical protein